ncbi:MAG: hypothetical protein Q4E33_05145 [Erysipelotrichaceae bacterium]|nr:hypothetical protein [Erysipelotrichaceae bacterium]
MKKTKEELDTLRQECLTLVTKLNELSQDELEEVYGGIDPKDRDIAMAVQNYALYPHMSIYDNNMGFDLNSHKKVVSDDANSMVIACGPNCRYDPKTCTFALNGHFCPLMSPINSFDKPKTYFVPED